MNKQRCCHCKQAISTTSDEQLGDEWICEGCVRSIMSEGQRDRNEADDAE